MFSDAKQIRENTLNLNRKFNEFGINVGMLISGKYGGVFDKLALQKILLGTWSEDPLAINGQINLIINRLIDLLNHEGNVIQQQVKTDESPNIAIEEMRIRQGVVYFSYFNRAGKMVRKDPINALIADVIFSNNPQIRTPASTSRSVRAMITYYQAGEKIGSITGGWEDLDQQTITKTVNLSFNGESKVLFLAVRILKDDMLFMYGMETDAEYFSVRDKDFRYKLSDGEAKTIRINIHLVGEKLDQKYDLVLHYAGKNGESRIEKQQ